MQQRYAFNSRSFEAIQLPAIVEKKGKDWIDFGSNNLYPDLLIELFNNSAMHHTAIEAKVDAITGEGFKYFGDEFINQKGETIDEIFAKITTDYVLFGGYSLNVIWSRDGSTIAEVYHLPFNNVRSGVLNEDEDVEHYYYSSNWAQHRKYKPVAYKAYSPTDNKGEDANQVYYCFDYTVGNFYYPLPSYVGAINDIDTDARVSRFHRSNLQQGLAPSMMLTFKNGIPTADEQTSIWRDIEKTFAGEDNAGKFFVNFSEPGREPDLQAIENANDDYYITLSARLSQSILTSHRISSPLLLGIKDAAGFSNNADEIQTAYNHFMGTVIVPMQKKLVKTFSKIINQTGRTVKLEVEPAEILYTVNVEGAPQDIIQPNETQD
jgi:hypothetical protein